MKMDPTIKKKKKEIAPPSRGLLIGLGAAFFVLAAITVGLTVYESFAHNGRFQMIEVPGFHELKLENAGMYAGIYQHNTTGPLPVQELSKLDIHVMSKGDYREVPVYTNSAGQVFNQFGLQGMPVFNFMIEQPGDYTLSAVYQEGTNGPTVQVLVFPQTIRNIKQTLVAGGGFFFLFLVLGILIFVRLNRWAPKQPA